LSGRWVDAEKVRAAETGPEQGISQRIDLFAMAADRRKRVVLQDLGDPLAKDRFNRFHHQFAVVDFEDLA
jgi:hypothetical protein